MAKKPKKSPNVEVLPYAKIVEVEVSAFLNAAEQTVLRSQAHLGFSDGITDLLIRISKLNTEVREGKFTRG